MIEILYFITLIIIMYIDFKKKQIPDVLVLLVGIWGISSVVFTDHITLIKRVLGMTAALFLFFIILLCAPGSFGGGDIKLSMALGFYMGIERWFYSFVYAVILAAGYAGILFFTKKYNKEKEIAFGPFLCAGALLAGFLK